MSQDLNIDSLLDSTLDDIADLPEFKNFPPGAHKALATLSIKEINKNTAVELAFKYIEPVQLDEGVDEADTPKEGDSCSTMFMMNNEFGQGAFKACAAPLAEGLGILGSSNRDIIEAVTDVEVLIVTSLRADKNDKTKFYMKVNEIGVV